MGFSSYEFLFGGHVIKDRQTENPWLERGQETPLMLVHAGAISQEAAGKCAAMSGLSRPIGLSGG